MLSRSTQTLSDWKGLPSSITLSMCRSDGSYNPGLWGLPLLWFMPSIIKYGYHLMVLSWSCMFIPTCFMIIFIGHSQCNMPMFHWSTQSNLHTWVKTESKSHIIYSWLWYHLSLWWPQIGGPWVAKVQITADSTNNMFWIFFLLTRWLHKLLGGWVMMHT